MKTRDVVEVSVYAELWKCEAGARVCAVLYLLTCALWPAKLVLVLMGVRNNKTSIAHCVERSSVVVVALRRCLDRLVTGPNLIGEHYNHCASVPVRLVSLAGIELVAIRSLSIPRKVCASTVERSTI